MSLHKQIVMQEKKLDKHTERVVNVKVATNKECANSLLMCVRAGLFRFTKHKQTKLKKISITADLADKRPALSTGFCNS